MFLQEILSHFLPSGESKKRLANKQIKINNIAVVDKTINVNVGDGFWELGDFLCALPKKELEAINAFKNIGIIEDIKDWFGDAEPTNIEQLKFLEGFTLISISKKEHFIFINQN